MKAALESGDRPRRISYKSNAILQLGLPTEFEYNGQCVFISNLNFQKFIDQDKSMLAKHLAALVDRSLYLDLTLHTKREVYCRILHMVRDEKLLDFAGLDEEKKKEILLWIKDNLENTRSLSLRTALKLAELARLHPTRWKSMGSAFLLRST